MPDEIETTAVDNAEETLTRAGEAAIDALEDAAEVTGAAVTEAIPSQIVGVLDRVIATQARIVQLVETTNNNITENLNALSRAQANTDVSAQRAAESAESIDEKLSPPEDSSPDQHEQPADLQELPQRKNLTEKEARENWWFGKAARRHGRK